MTINNITGTNSLKSNCQPDQSSGMLSDIHEFITVCQEQSLEPNNSIVSVDDTTFCNCGLKSQNCDCDDLNSMIAYHPQSELEETIDIDAELRKIKVESIEINAISYSSSRICQKIFKTTKCEECRSNFELMDEPTTLSRIGKVVSSLNAIIPQICFERSIKKKLMNHIRPMKTYLIGCSDHNEEIDEKIKKLAADQVVLTFCNDVNKILSGKTKTLPDNPNIIQKLALVHKIKKRRIGKYSDKFKDQ